MQKYEDCLSEACLAARSDSRDRGPAPALEVLADDLALAKSRDGRRRVDLETLADGADEPAVARVARGVEDVGAGETALEELAGLVVVGAGRVGPAKREGEDQFRRLLREAKRRTG